MEQLRQQEESLRSSLARYLTTSHARQRHAADRAELFRRATGAGASSSASAVSTLEKEHESLLRSHAAIEGMGDLTGSILRSLEGQRERLKGAQTTVLNILTSLGVSRSALSAIRSRAGGDAMLLYGGMIIIVALIVVLWRWRASSDPVASPSSSTN